LDTSSPFAIYVYQLNDDEEAVEELEGSDTPACSNHILPSKNLDGLWESLIYESNIKQELLDYVQTTLIFSDHQVNSNLITWNRFLLHGFH
jgi:hypothetical protein